MDSRPPPPNMMSGPTSYPPPPPTNSSPMISPNSGILAPATARFPFVSTSPAPPQHPPPLSEPFSATFDGSPSSPAGLAKKKRGRPRKYSPDGGNIGLALAPTHVSPATPAAGDSGSADPPAKKHRGRPPGSGKKQLDALGSGGLGFTPHVIVVDSGEDIIAKLAAFAQQGPRTICILSANGTVRDVILGQPAPSATSHTYEGLHSLISLTGSFHPSENSGGRVRPGSLSVIMAAPDGRVVGGDIVGALTAVSPLQVIVGSFIMDAKKSSSNAVRSGPSPSSALTSQILTFGAPATPTSPPTSQGPSTESSEDNDQSSFNRGAGLYNNASQNVHNMQMYHHPLWAGQTHH